MATVQELESALVKADAAGDTAAAKAFADEIRRMRAAAPKAEAPARKRKPSEQVFERPALLSLPSAAIYASAKELGLGATELAGRGLRAVGLETPGNALVRAAQAGRAETPADVARAQQAYPNAFAGLKLGSQIAMTAPLGGVLAAPARAVSPALATAIQTGGMTVPAASGALTRTALRAAGGAALGGASTALISPEDAATGAAVGALVPTAVAPALKVAASGIGKLIDYARGRVSDVRAGQLLQEAFGGDTNTIVNILKNAPDDVTARQAMVDAGIDADAVFALGEQVEKRNLSGAFSRLAEAADAKRKALLTTASGGPTQEAARQAREAAKGRLTEATAPLREQALEAATETGQVMPALRGYAGQFADEAAQQVENVRRFTRAGEKAAEAAEPFYPVLGLPRTPGKYTYMGELPAQAEQRAVAAAQRSLEAGAKSRDAAARLAELEEAGLKPITGERIVNAISRKIADPDIGTNKDARRVLTAVGREIERWIDANGVVDARALYAIRKNAIAAEAARMTKGLDPAAQKKFAAKIVRQLNPIIDDAIETAGGKTWGEYLRAFGAGAKEIDRRELVAEAQKLYAKDPKKLISLVQGDNPEVIEKVFGPGTYEIVSEIAGELGPSRLTALGRVASELSRDEQAALNAAAGAGQLEELLKKNQSIRLNLLNRFATVTNEAIDILERNVSAAERRALDKAFQSGKNMAEALQVLPAARQAKLLNLFYSRQATPAVTRAVGLGTAQPNTMAPPAETRNAMAR